MYAFQFQQPRNVGAPHVFPITLSVDELKRRLLVDSSCMSVAQLVLMGRFGEEALFSLAHDPSFEVRAQGRREFSPMS